MLLHCLPFTFLLLFPCLLTPHVLNVETGALHARLWATLALVGWASKGSIRNLDYQSNIDKEKSVIDNIILLTMF